MMNDITKTEEYHHWLKDLKRQIQKSQIKAAISVNSQLILLYWDMGRQIVEKQEKAKWGSGFIEQLSKDLREEFPEMKGFSAKNLRIMRFFYTFYSQFFPTNNQPESIWKQLVSKLQSIENNDVIDSEPFSPDLKNQIVKQLVSQLEESKITISEQPVPILETQKTKQLVSQLGNNENELVEQPVQQLVAQLVPFLYHSKNKDEIDA